MGQTQIAVVEDCVSALSTYQRILDPLYKTQYFETWNSVLHCLNSRGYQPSLFIAELEPRQDGSFLKVMKGDFQKFFENRVIIVSACEDPVLMRDCFEMGALDFLVKPVNPWELLVKIDRYLRMSQTAFPFLKWDPVFNQVQSDNVTVTLTSKEFQILSLLNRAAGAPLTRESIIKKTWGDITVAAKSLDVHLFNLRRKIEPLGLEIIFLRPNYYKLATAVRPATVPGRDSESSFFTESKKGERSWS